MIQIVQPDTTVTDGPGWCLRFNQNVNRGVPIKYQSAWDAWEATATKYFTREMPDVSVPVWFSHYGTYGSPPEYKNWGHVVQWIPGRGYLSSPTGTAIGQKWLSSIQEVEQAFNSKFVGWSLDIGGKTVAENTPQPPEGYDPMAKLYRNKGTSEVAAIGIDTGYIYTVPTYDYLVLIQGWHLFENDEPIPLDDNVFKYVKDLAKLAPAYKAAHA